MKIIDGLVDTSMLARFPSGFPEKNGYASYVANCVGLEGALACAALFAPEFLEHEGLILLNTNVRNNEANISTRFGTQKKDIEQYNNLVSLSDFFLQAEDEACEDIELITAFGEILVHYWSARLKILFPTKNFIFLLKEGLFDEDGLCLTFFEN